MPVYAINYSLRERSPRDYKILAAAIRGASDGDCLQVFDTFWLLSSNAKAKDIYNHLAKCLRKEDALIVQRVSNEFACALPGSQVAWLQKVVKVAPDPVIPSCPPLDLP
ncbi:MAG: hypothetical protein LIP28_09460 [Deltaproteobacteria bacterium]|nr:hypothetical protein [Deltaproteobacteria bacterium]